MKTRADLRLSMLLANQSFAVTGATGQLVTGQGFMSTVSLVSLVAATATFYNGTDNTGTVLRILKTTGGDVKVSWWIEFDLGLFVEVT